jgi:hypothetical protein
MHDIIREIAEEEKEPAKPLSPLKQQMADKRLKKQLKRAKYMQPTVNVPIRNKNAQPNWAEAKFLLDGLHATICEFREQMAIYQNLNRLPDEVKDRIEKYKNIYLRDLAGYMDQYNALVTELKVGAVEEDDLPNFYNIGMKVEQCKNNIVSTMIPLSVQLQADLALA